MRWLIDGARFMPVASRRRKALVKRFEHAHADNADTFAISSDGRRLAISQDHVVIVDA